MFLRLHHCIWNRHLQYRRSSCFTRPLFLCATCEEGQVLTDGRRVAFFGVVFGGIHCFGWYFIYPTPFEHHFWRASAVAITVIPLVVAPIVWEFRIEKGIRQESSPHPRSLRDYPPIYLRSCATLFYCPSTCTQKPTTYRFPCGRLDSAFSSLPLLIRSMQFLDAEIGQSLYSHQKVLRKRRESCALHPSNQRPARTR